MLLRPAHPASPGGAGPGGSEAPLELLRRLEWQVRNAVENVLSGEYRSAIRGRGMEFDQVVRYEFGDDVRDIDWNVTARLGEPYRKKFIEEREVTLLLVFEDSPTLAFGSAGQTRREALLELAGLVMLLGAVNRDRVGTVHARPGGCTFREPVCGRGAIMHAAAALLGGKAPHPAEPAPEIPWHLIARAAPRHSILVWLGDFPPRAEPEGWNVIRRRYEAIGFRVDDPWDRAFPDGGSFAAWDPVAARLVTLRGSPAERSAHAAWRAGREAAWTGLFPNPLARLVAGAGEKHVDSLVRFFHARMRAGAGRARL